MVHPIPNNVKKVWQEWNVRGVILLSLLLQTVLIFSAPFRKRTANKLVIVLIWSSYLLADWAANFAVGHISSKQSDDTDENINQDDVLKAFWAPFLLVHLGGPDPITSFSPEDNELWLRHFLGLLTQVIATVYVFIQTVPGNRLWIPTVLMFLAGIVKYAERTRSLYRASLNIFREFIMKRPDPGPNYAKVMEEKSKKIKDGMKTWRINKPDERPPTRSMEKGDLTELEVVQSAYHFFLTFRGLIVETIISSPKRNESRDFFFERNATDAYKVIAAELNFIYESLFTKAIVVRTHLGYIFRVLSFCAIVAALGLFFTVEKHGFREFDVGVSYTLLLGAIFLDGVALFMLVFSDWTVANLPKNNRFLEPVFTRYLCLKNPQPTTKSDKGFSESDKGFFEYIRAGLFRKWSESVSGYSFITYCLGEHYEKIREYKRDGPLYCKAIYFVPVIYDYVRKYFKTRLGQIIDYMDARNLVDEWKYAESQKLTPKLWEFIFNELNNKATEAEDDEISYRIFSAQGAYVLQENNWGDKIEDIFPYVENVEYDESLLLWHIATELCYDVPANKDVKDNKEFSKILSDYMLYLIVLQPTLMSAVAGTAQMRFRDTSAEAMKFFSRSPLGRKDNESARKKILKVETNIPPVTVKGDRCKSVLFDASILAKKLREFDSNTMWKIISVVWVEKLSFAASHCRPEAHAQQLSKGGELITFVWLLMAHFGLGEFQISEGHARAKLIAE